MKSKYETNVAPRLEERKDGDRSGATDKEVAKRLGIFGDNFINTRKSILTFSTVKKFQSPKTQDARAENVCYNGNVRKRTHTAFYFLKRACRRTRFRRRDE